MVDEFKFLEKIKSKYALSHIGDDCAVLPKDDQTDMVVTADLLVEDIDFRLKWTKPEQLGHKALAVSLSDIAAMGAAPKWAMLSLGFPQDLWKTDFVDRFYEGWYALARQYGVELVGGDLSRTPDKLLIDSIVGGEAPKGKSILRSGALAGDGIFVSGSLGGAAGGLRLLQEGQKDADAAIKLIQLQLKPRPQVTLAKQLSTLGLVRAMIDLSDGLSSDLFHICKASGVGAVIYADKLPIDPLLTEFFRPEECLEMALNGGEDFELLFAADVGTRIEGTTLIGEITVNAGVIELIDGNEKRLLRAGGFRHF